MPNEDLRANDGPHQLEEVDASGYVRCIACGSGWPATDTKKAQAEKCPAYFLRTEQSSEPDDLRAQPKVCFVNIRVTCRGCAVEGEFFGNRDSAELYTAAFFRDHTNCNSPFSDKGGNPRT